MIDFEHVQIAVRIKLQIDDVGETGGHHNWRAAARWNLEHLRPDQFAKVTGTLAADPDTEGVAAESGAAAARAAGP